MNPAASGSRFLQSVSGLVLLLSVIASPGWTDTLFETSREAPGYHEPGTWGGRFSMVNDTAGPDHTVEWDDGRTAGYELFLRMPIPLYFEFGYSGFTYRSTPAEPGWVSRSDSIHMILGGIREGELWGGRGRVMAGIGGLFFGNYYGYQAQNWLHGALGQDRPIPPESSYSNRAWSFLASGEAGITVPGGWPVVADLSATFSSLGYWEISPTIGLVLESPYGASRLDINYRFIDSGDSPLPADEYFTQSRGFWLEYEFRVHGLYLKYSLNPAGGLTQGSIGMAFSGGSRATPDALWEGGFRMDFSLPVGASGFVNRILWTPENWKTGRSLFSLSLDLQSGAGAEGSPYSRFQKTLAGAEWSLPLRLGNQVYLEPFTGLSLGYVYNKDYMPIDTVYRAELADTAWAGLARLSMGLRFAPLTVAKENRRLGYGLVMGTALDLAVPSSDPFSAVFYVGLSFSDLPEHLTEADSAITDMP